MKAMVIEVLSNKDVMSRYTASEQHVVNGPSEFSLGKQSVVPVDLHSAFYPKGVQSIL